MRKCLVLSSYLNRFELTSRSSEGCCLPVSLDVFLPHDRVELVIVLITENEADVIVIDFGINEEGSFEIYATKGVIADGQARIGVLSLNNFSALIVNDPVWIDLRFALGVKNHSLVCTEIGGEDSRIIGAIVEVIWNLVSVVIFFANVTNSVTVCVFLVGIVDQSAVIALVYNSIVINILIASITSTVIVGI